MAVQSSTNFCNVNNNGNVNNWNASNSIGVRPDFTAVHRAICRSTVWERRSSPFRQCAG